MEDLNSKQPKKTRTIFIIRSFITTVLGAVSCDVFYGRPTSRDYYGPEGYYDYRIPRSGRLVPAMAGGVRGSRVYYGGRSEDGDFERGDLLRKRVYDAQSAGLKSVDGERGAHDVSLETEGNQDYVVKAEGGGFEGSEGLVKHRAVEYGTAGKDGYEGGSTTSVRKGHSNTGFEKSYGNSESGKDSKFVDEEYKVGGESFDHTFGDRFQDFGKDGHEEAVRGGSYAEEGLSSGAARDGLRSSGVHSLKQGKHSQLNSYNDQDLRKTSDREARLRDSSLRSGVHSANVYTDRNAFFKPYFYPSTLRY